MAIVIKRSDGLKLLLQAANAAPYPAPTVTPLNADIFFQYKDDASGPQYVGTFPVGREVQIPLATDLDRDVIVRAVARGPQGQQYAPDLRDVTPEVVESEREQRQPVIGQMGASTYLKAIIGVSYFPRHMRTRRIQVASDAGFTTIIAEWYQDVDRSNAETPRLSEQFSIQRLSPTLGTVTYYIKVAHTSFSTSIAQETGYQAKLEGLRWGPDSDVLTVTLADNNGAGGSSGTFNPFTATFQGYGSGAGNLAFSVPMPGDTSGGVTGTNNGFNDRLAIWQGSDNLTYNIPIFADRARSYIKANGFTGTVGAINAKVDYLASGSADTTTGNISASSAALTVPSATDFIVGQGITVVGAGTSGANLNTTVQAISTDGLTITLTAGAATTVTGTAVYHDDTAVIQAAIDAAESASGRTVMLPNGVYRLRNTLTATGEIRILGESKQATVLYSTANEPIITVSKDVSSYQGPVIENLMIRGDVSAGSAQHGLVCDDSEVIFMMTVRNVTIEKCGGSGLVVKKCFSSTFEDIYVSDCAGYPILYDAANMPSNLFRRVDAGLLRASAPAGYRIKAGTFIAQNCNGIYNVVLGSRWAVVGRKDGVDGDTSNNPAIAIWENCNFESYTLSAVHHYFGSKSDFRGVCTFAAQASIILDPAGVNSSTTAITANSTGGFPSSGKIQMELETISYTSINSTQFLGCTRGIDGTTAASHPQYTIVGNKQVKPLVYEVDNIGNYPAFATRGIIEDSCNFNDGPETQYANNQAVHCNDIPPLETAGRGAGVNPGNASAPLGTYYNSTTSKIEALPRADGSLKRIEVNDDRVFPNPGVRWIEINNTSGGPIDVTLPPPTWYKTQEIIIVKDVAGNAGTHTISIYGGGGSHIDADGVFTMEQDYQSAIFIPHESDTVNGHWRLIATYPPPGYAKTTGGGFAGYFGQYVDDQTLTGGPLYELSGTIISKRGIVCETDNDKDVGSSGGNRFRTFFVGTSVRLPDSSSPSLARNSDVTTGIGVNSGGIHQSVAGTETFTVTSLGVTVTGDVTISGSSRQITGTGLNVNFGANPDIELSAGGVAARVQAISGSYVQIGTTSNHNVLVIVNNAGKWTFRAGGLFPETTQTLGGSSNRVGDLYGNGFLDLAEISTPSTPASGTLRLYAKSGGGVYYKNPAGTETALGGGGISGTLTSGRVTLSNGASAVTDSANLTFGSSILTLTSAGGNGHILISDTTNTIDLRLGTLAGAPDRAIVGTMTNDPLVFYQNGGESWGLDTNKHFLPYGTTNTRDIGSSSQKVRDAYIGRDVFIDRRIVGAGSAPTSSTGTGAGTSPSITVDGSQLGCYVSVTTGSSPATNAKVFDLTLSAAPNYYVAMLTPVNVAAKSLSGNQQVFVSDADATTTKVTVKSGSTGLAASTTYDFYLTFLAV